MKININNDKKIELNALKSFLNSSSDYKTNQSISTGIHLFTQNNINNQPSNNTMRNITQTNDFTTDNNILYSGCTNNNLSTKNNNNNNYNNYNINNLNKNNSVNKLSSKPREANILKNNFLYNLKDNTNRINKEENSKKIYFSKYEERKEEIKKNIEHEKGNGLKLNYKNQLNNNSKNNIYLGNYYIDIDNLSKNENESIQKRKIISKNIELTKISNENISSPKNNFENSNIILKNKFKGLLNQFK